MGGSAIRLGLIGDNIAASEAQALHETAGRLCSLAVTYDLLRPADLDKTFEDVLRHCREAGYRGVNITYPYKERVVEHLQVDDPVVRSMAACNTVLFGSGGPRGFNTDYSGFLAAYRSAFVGMPPGRVALAGAGGVARAIAFALAELGASELRLFDLAERKSMALADAIRAVHGQVHIQVCAAIENAACGADGLVNATPLGMAGIGGCAFPAEVIDGQRWAFDAVYTPVDTPFVLAARVAGLLVMSGYELFLYQGIDAFRLFTGREIAEGPLREALKLAHDRPPV